MSETAGNGQRTNSTIFQAIMALVASSGWAYALLGSDDTKETRQAISLHAGELRVLRVQVDQLLAERASERDRRRED